MPLQLYTNCNVGILIVTLRPVFFFISCLMNPTTVYFGKSEKKMQFGVFNISSDCIFGCKIIFDFCFLLSQSFSMSGKNC